MVLRGSPASYRAPPSVHSRVFWYTRARTGDQQRCEVRVLHVVLPVNQEIRRLQHATRELTLLLSATGPAETMCCTVHSSGLHIALLSAAPS